MWAVLVMSHPFQYALKYSPQNSNISRLLSDFTANAATQKPSGRVEDQAGRAEIISSGEIFHFLAVIVGAKPDMQRHFCGLKIGFWQHLTISQNIRIYWC